MHVLMFNVSFFSIFSFHSTYYIRALFKNLPLPLFKTYPLKMQQRDEFIFILNYAYYKNNSKQKYLTINKRVHLNSFPFWPHLKKWPKTTSEDHRIKCKLELRKDSLLHSHKLHLKTALSDIAVTVEMFCPCCLNGSH